jgi:hypothetical protein
MTLTVESGAGDAGADAYVSLTYADAYFDARSNTTWAAATDDAKEAAIRYATAYIDTIARYKGVKTLSTQALEFPRTDLVDWSGYTITGLPTRVQQATCELALRALSEDLYVDLDRGGAIAAESVAGISVSYRPDATPGKTFRSAMQLLKPYMRAPDELAMPYDGGTTVDPMFSIGMLDGQPLDDTGTTGLT